MNVRQSDSQGRSEQLLLNGSSMPVLVRPSSGRMYSGISFFHKGQHAQHKPFKCHSSKLHCNDSSYVRVNSADCLRNDIPKDDLILRRHSLEALTNLSYLDYDDDNKPSFEVKKTTYENDERSKEISALFESSTRPSMRQEVEDSSLHQFMKTDNDRHFWKLHNILGLEEQSLPPRKPITRSSLKKRCASSGSNHFQHFNTSHSVERLSTNGKKYPNKDSKDCHFSNNKKMNFLPNIVNSKPNKTTLDEKLENDTFRHSNLSQFQNQHFQTLNSIKVYDALMMVTVSDDKRSKAACKIQRWYKRHNTQENLPLNVTQESACDILKNNFPEDLDENCTSLVKTRIFNGKKYMHSTTPFKPLLPLVERFNEKMPLIYADPTIQNADATFVCDPHYLNEDLSIQLLNAKLLLEKPLLNRKSKLNRRKSDSDMDAIQQNLFLESEIKKSISENVLLSSQQTYLLMHSNLTYNHGTSSNLSECLKQLPGKLDSAVFHHNFSEQVDSLLESTHTNVNEKIDSVDDSKEELKQESAEKPTNNLNSDVVENHSQTLGELKNYNQKEEKKEFEKQELIITKKPPLPNVAAKVSTSETKDFSLVVDSTSHNDTQLSELFNSSSKPNLTSCQSLKEEEKDHSNCVEYSSVITSVTNLHSDEAESLSSRDHSDKSDSSSFPAPETKNESTLTAIKLEELNRNSPQQFSSKYKGLSEDKIQDIMHYLDEVEGSEILQEQEQMAYTQETSVTIA